MTENELSYIIRGVIFEVYYSLGPGLFEHVYEKILTHKIEQKGLKVRTQVALPVVFEGIKLEAGYRIDLLVEEQVIVEIKSVENLAEVHHKQLITYLKLSGKSLGILVNFNTADIQKSIYRKVNRLKDAVPVPAENAEQSLNTQK
jgi:GxxExxY protein